MLRPELYSYSLGPDLVSKLRPLILRALVEEAERNNIKVLTVSRAKELVAAANPPFHQILPTITSELADSTALPHKEISLLLHEALAESARFFRMEGAKVFREVQKISDPKDRATQLWTALFDRKLFRWLRERGYIANPDFVETVDLFVEAVRLWVADIASKLDTGQEITSTAFFLDTETDIQATIEFEGRKLRLRGRPDALIIDPTAKLPEVVEYKLGHQGKVELQIVQTVLYMLLVNAAKGAHLDRATIQFFRLVGDTPPDVAAVDQNSSANADMHPKSGEAQGTSTSAFPDVVERAFAGYIGNQAAVRRLKIECTLAVRSTPVKMPINLMMCGPGGLGKTELARRVARALELPLVDVPADTIKSIDNFITRVRATLEDSGVPPEEIGTEAGLPKWLYPPLVVFLDEIHLLKRPDQFLNLFEPKERRAVGSKEVGDLSAATFICATTEKGQLASPFRSRFTSIDLEPYSAEDIATIVRPAFPSKTNADPEVLLALADIGRRNPRIALSRAAEAQRLHEFDPHAYPLTLEGLRKIAKDTWNVDTLGLTAADREYLKALSVGSRGLNSLIQILPVQAEEIRTVVEPYLLQLGLINIRPKGRELTALGRKKLNELTQDS